MTITSMTSLQERLILWGWQLHPALIVWSHDPVLWYPTWGSGGHIHAWCWPRTADYQLIFAGSRVAVVLYCNSWSCQGLMDAIHGVKNFAVLKEIYSLLVSHCDVLFLIPLLHPVGVFGNKQVRKHLGVNAVHWIFPGKHRSLLTLVSLLFVFNECDFGKFLEHLLLVSSKNCSMD